MSNIIHNIKQKVWWLILETNTIITYLACIFFLLIIGRIFILPLKSILKLIGNSIIGGILIFIINLIGGIFNFHIGLNIVTALVVGILGIPRSNTFNIFKIILLRSFDKRKLLYVLKLKNILKYITICYIIAKEF